MTSLPPPPPTTPVPRAPELPAEQGPALPGRRPRGVRAWPPWIAFIGMLTGFVATFIGSAIVLAAAGSAGTNAKGDLRPGFNIGLTVFQNIALFTAALFFARTISRPRGRDFGLRAPRRLRRVIGLLLGVWGAFYFLSAMWALALGLHDKSALPDRLGADQSTLNLVAVSLLVCVIAPVGEELFFRGFYFGALRNWRGAWPAAIITGITFGAIHYGSAPDGQLVPLAIFGVGLCMLYHWSGSLYPSIALHAVNNAIAFGVESEHWSWWIVLLAMAGSVALALTVAATIRRVLGGVARGDRGAAPAVSA